MSVSGEKDPIECRLRIDGTEVLFSSSDSSVINILKISLIKKIVNEGIDLNL